MDLVPEVGVEPTRPFGQRILSPLRLPIPPLGHLYLYYTNEGSKLKKKNEKVDIGNKLR